MPKKVVAHSPSRGASGQKVLVFTVPSLWPADCGQVPLKQAHIGAASSTLRLMQAPPSNRPYSVSTQSRGVRHGPTASDSMRANCARNLRIFFGVWG